MNCNCVEEVTDLISKQLETHHGEKPETLKCLQVESEVCRQEGRIFTQKLFRLGYEANWNKKTANHPKKLKLKVSICFCPFCGKSAITPKETPKPATPAAEPTAP